MTVSFAIRPSDFAGDTEPSLVERLAAGDVGAFDEVYRAHHVAVRAFANRFLGDAAAAEDLVHDVFVVLRGAIRRFRGDASLRSFLIAIAIKRSYKHVRSAGRRRAAMAKLAEQPDVSPITPDALVARQQLAHALYAALDQLPGDQRTAFVLCEIDDMTAAEVGVLVDAPEATVRTRLFHARKKLRALLTEVRDVWEVR